jgi:hypothetical protein
VAAEEVPLFNLKMSIVIALALLVPFAVAMSTDSEPYPAVLFPGGGGVVQTRNSVVEYNAVLLYGIDQEGLPVQIDVAPFLDPIPTQFLVPLVAADFGLNDDTELEIRIKKIGRTFSVPGVRVSEADRQGTRAWLGDRLEALGLDPGVLITQRVRITADSNSGREVSRTTIRESTLDL